MKRIKGICCVVLAILLLGQTICTWGAETEWYTLQEIDDQNMGEFGNEKTGIVPYSRYILGTSVSLKRPSSGVIWMRSEVYCTETMSKITTVFTLQKKVGSSWVDVGQGTVSVSNSNSMYKTMEATGVSSGTYRCIANTQVVSKSGYVETSSVVSGSI